MQLLLMVIFVLSALGYLGWFLYKNYFSKKSKCDTCAFNKVYDAKLEELKGR